MKHQQHNNDITDIQLDYARQVLKYTARELRSDSRMNGILAAVCMSLGHYISKRGCIKCINDAMDFLSKKTGIPRGHGRNKRENGKVLSAI